MIRIARQGILLILAVGAFQAVNQAAFAGCCDGPLCRMPVTKAYRIQSGFCAQQLVALIPQCVPADASSEDCGPHGIPAVYAAGNSVLVRQTPEAHERIHQFLANLGVLVPSKRETLPGPK